MNRPTSGLRRATRAGILLATLVPLAGGLACAQTVRGQAHPSLADLDVPIRRLAVVPLRATGSLARQQDEEVGPGPDRATELVGHHLTEALARRGIEVVPPDDAARALGLVGAPMERLVPRAVARTLHTKLGVDAVLIGEAWRYVERSGQAAGTRQPASIGFEVVLYRAPGGQKLWSGVFDETQQALLDNVLSTSRYPGGGARWLTAEELLRWGATETANSVPLGPPAPTAR